VDRAVPPRRCGPAGRRPLQLRALRSAHAFKPRLSFGEAVVATLGTLLRIFLGSLLFAIWGSYAWFAWTALPNYLLRVVVILPMFLLFLVCMLLLLSAIGALQRAVWPKHP